MRSLGHAVTKLTDALLNDAPGTDVPMPLPDEKPRVLRKRLTPQQRLDLAVLAGLYDQPPSGITLPRWKKLCKTLRIGWRLPLNFWRNSWRVALTLIGRIAGLRPSGGSNGRRPTCRRRRDDRDRRG